MRLIDADGLIEKAYWHGEHPDVENLYAEGVEAVDMCDIDEAPTIEAEPVRHGRWYWKPIDERTSERTCSVCGQGGCDDFNYFPNCGAKMDGGKHD